MHLVGQKRLTEAFSGDDAVRFFCQKKPHCNSWLAVIPSVARRTLIPTVEFRCLLRWTLGIPLISGDQGPVACPKCTSQMGPSGHHLVCCHLNHISRRHHAVVEALADVTRRAGFPCRKEQGAPDGTRPGNLFIPRLDVHGPGAVDVTVRDPLAPSHPVSQSAVQGWHLAQEQDKIRKYGQMCNRLGWRLVPFVVDVWGGLGEDASALVGTLLKALLGQKEGWQSREVEATVWQQLGFAAMREVGKQLVWSVHTAAEPVYAPMTHQPYF